MSCSTIFTLITLNNRIQIVSIKEVNLIIRTMTVLAAVTNQICSFELDAGETGVSQFVV